MTLKIIHKNNTSAGQAPAPSDLDIGEIAVNSADAELYTKDNAGNVRKFQNTTTGTADGVQFTQAGSGAVQRTVESKLQDVVSVKDFGAVGDGLADDTAAIQSALNSFPSVLANGTGGNLFFPTGRYLISSTLVIPFGVNIFGTGDYGSRLSASPSFSGNAIIYVELSGTDYNNSDISHFSIDCNNISGVKAIEYESAYSNVTLEDIYIRNVNPDAIGVNIKPATTGVSVCESLFFKNIYVVSESNLSGITNAQPLIKLEKVQETTLVNVKALGHVGGAAYAGSIGLELIDCRGISVINGGYGFCERGIKVSTNSRPSDGISLQGVTYEANTVSELTVEGSPGFSLSGVMQQSPRYQFPFAPLAVFANECSLCEFHVKNKDVELGSTAKSILIIGNGAGTITAASGSRYGSVGYPNAVDENFVFGPNITVQSDNTPFVRYTVDGRPNESYTHKWSASSVDDFGFSLVNKANKTIYTCSDNGTFATLGFLGNSPVSKRTVTGSRGGNAALASLLSGLEAFGLIIDNTTS